VYYENVSQYRDFEFTVEADGPGGPRVGMWAKRFMSDPTYAYIGTITSWSLYKSVIGGSLPKLAAETDKEAKLKRNDEVRKALVKLAEGEFRSVYAHRLGDALALCRHDWEHFRTSRGEIPARRRELPIQLYQRMVADAKRRKRTTPQTTTTSTPSETAVTSETSTWLETTLQTPPPPMRQRMHLLAEVNGCVAGRGIEVTAAYGGRQPETVDEFVRRPIAAGSFVLTEPEVGIGRLGRSCTKLGRMQLWIWKVLQVYRPGAKLPANINCVGVRTEVTYECHLHVPDEGVSWANPVRPVWDLQAETTFLATPAEVAARAQSFGDVGPALHVPLTALLRRANILGGGFLLTSTRRVPPIVKTFIASRSTGPR
jgi:hypothetical protein